MSLSRDTWHEHDDEVIEAICREFGLVKPLPMQKNDGALCCASIAEALSLGIPTVFDELPYFPH